MFFLLSGVAKSCSLPFGQDVYKRQDEKRLIELATHVLEAWRGYTDESAFIFAETDGRCV